MKKKKMIIIGVSLLFLALIGTFCYVGLHQTKSSKVRESYCLEQMDPLVFQGNVKPRKNQEVYVDAGLGTLKKIHVKDGQEVKKGDVLLTYINETVKGQIKEQKRQIDRTQMNINSAQSTLDRYRDKLDQIEDDLWKARKKAKEVGVDPDQDPSVTGLESQKENQLDVISGQIDTVKNAVADRDDAKQAYEDAKKELYKQVKAKMDGTVKRDDEGKTNGAVPLLLVYSKGIAIEASASEYDYPYLKEKQEVQIYVNSTEESLAGTISHVDALAMNSTGVTEGKGVSYEFQVLPKEEIPYGFSVQVKVPIDEIRIPEEFVVEEKDQFYVFRYEKEIAKKQKVSLEKRNGYYIVRDTLKEGDILILPSDEIRSGDKVVIADDKTKESE